MYVNTRFPGINHETDIDCDDVESLSELLTIAENAAAQSLNGFAYIMDGVKCRGVVQTYSDGRAIIF
jgi:hypothetical protein